MIETITTAFGRFTARSGRRVNIAQDYESCALKSFRDAAQVIDASLVVDVGANVGVYSVYAASLPIVQAVHAFEPENEAFEALSQNFEMQIDARKLTHHKLALSDIDGPARLKLIEPMHGMNAVQAVGSEGPLIQVRRLDGIIALRGKKACIKIDVEGHERQVLAGAASFLKENPSYVQVECLKSSTQTSELLFSLGYSLVFVLNHDFIFLHHALAPRKDDILAKIYANLATDMKELTAYRMDARARRRERRAKILKQQDLLS